MDWTTVGWISYALLWLVVIVQVVLTLALARLVGQLHRRIPPSGARVIDPGPEIGHVMEKWEGTDLLGNALCLAFPRQRALFLLYVSPHCSVCAWLLPAAKRFFKEISVQAEGVWVMTPGNRRARIDYARANGLTAHPVVSEDELPASWRVGGAPFGLWIGADGAVQAKGMVDRREHLEGLRYAAEVGHPSVQSYLTERAEEEQQREPS
jgi:methylamine dehydrogenase accessory protein MauD